MKMTKRSKKPAQSYLKISEGVTSQDRISEEIAGKIKIAKKSVEQLDYYLQGIKNSNRTILSKSITLIESSLDSHKIIAQQIISNILPLTGKAIRIGITGVPGVGKSTFIESFGKFLSEKNLKIAVLAIDPSSSKSKGSILGDKTRMEQLATDINAFIRPSPTAGNLGGVARKTRETMMLCEAAGFNVILIETVGVGQSEVVVRSMVDFFLLLLLPGSGDELQGIKRGIMEMADLVVVNKAEGENQNKANQTLTEVRNAIHYLRTSDSGWIPKTSKCSAFTREGIPEIWGIINDFLEQTRKSGFFEKQRKGQSLQILHQSISEALLNQFYNNKKISSLINDTVSQIYNGTLSPYLAANNLLNEFNRRKDVQ
jgi:LAO/AO transport system kinase